MRLLDDAGRDLRYALRVLRRSPGFAAVAVLSLALGIGANTAIFSVIDAVMLRSLAVDRPNELVVLVRTSLSRKISADYVTYPMFERFRDAGIFAGITASMAAERSGLQIDGPGGGDGSTTVVGLVSGTYFATFGVRASIGRTLTADDDRAPGAGPVAVISEPYWRRQFGRAADVVGRTFTLMGTTYTIVGVAQAGFAGEDIETPTDLWIPITMEAQVMPEQPGLLANAGSNWVRVIGRLKPGVPMAQAEAAARASFAGAPSSPNLPNARLDLAPAGRGFAAQREFLAEPLEILLIVVGFVLLIACANVATLLLARSAARRREIALRIAIGARRGRLIRQLLAESLLIAAAAGMSGFLLAVWMTHVFAAIVASGRRPLGVDAHPDVRMLAATGALSLLTGLLFGVVPAFRATKLSLTPALAGTNDARGGGSGGVGAGKILVIGQVAASIVLAIGAALFVRTLRNLEAQDVGFDRQHVSMFWMAAREAGRERQALAPLFAAAQERVAAIPGVVSVSPSSDGVLSGFIGLRSVAPEGHPPDPGEDTTAQWNLVAPGFFGTIGMRLLAGRDFTSQDTDTSPPVAVVNEAMARHFFGDVNPLGKRFAFGRDLGQRVEIVGLVQDAKYFSARDADVRMVFLPYRQNVASLYRMCVVVRTATDSPALTARIRDELRTLDPSMSVRNVTTTQDQLDRTLSDERLMAWLSAFFGIAAAGLACIGLYGLMSFTVARRTREIGIRVALGETRASVIARVLRESLVLAAAGVALGVPAAIAGTRSIQALLFGISPTDPLTMAGASALLLCVAALAALVPARRASRVNPILALRTE